MGEAATRVCSKCGVEKRFEDFTKQQRCIGGRSHVCKECTQAAQREKRRVRNADEEYKKQRERLNAERKAKRLAESRAKGPRSKGKHRYVEGSPTKICSTCDNEKPLAEFPTNKLCAGGVTGVCKACNNARQEAWRRMAFREREDFRERRRLSQEKAKAKKYGIPLEQLQQMREESGGVCEICKKPPNTIGNTSSKSLHIDHNHNTGFVRGLLCSRCNLCLGQIEENPGILAEMLIYMGKYKIKEDEACRSTS